MRELSTVPDAELTRRSRAERTERLLEELQPGAGEGTDQVLRRVVEVNMDLAKTLARRYYGRGENPDDLDQAAYLGLVQAVRRFEPGRGKTFLAFAVPTILGELRRHFRDRCWAVRPPRRIQELQARMMRATETFTHEHGHQPCPWELAAALDVELDDVVEALSADGCFTPTSLDGPLEPHSSTSVGDVLGADERQHERVDARLTLRPLISALGEREHRIIELRYYWDRTQEQIAQEIGISQMQVSRILSRTMTRLRSLAGAEAAA